MTGLFIKDGDSSKVREVLCKQVKYLSLHIHVGALVYKKSSDLETAIVNSVHQRCQARLHTMNNYYVLIVTEQFVTV